MTRRGVLAVSAVMVCGLVWPAGPGDAQQKSLKGQLVGTWVLSSASEKRADGADRWGSNPKGMLVFDGAGRYVLVINRGDLPKFAANRVDGGTAEENQAVLRGMIATFGTYTVNEADRTIVTQVEGGSFPNLQGGTQRRVLKAISADEFTYANPATTAGTTAEVTWKRAR